MTAIDYVTACSAFVGTAEYSSAHRAIIAAYNAIEPLPRRYPMKLNDPWCAAFLSAVAHISGFRFPSECGCWQMAEMFKADNRWKPRSGSVLPGDIVFFSWKCNGVFDHVGVVESVADGRINTIEGNRDNTICRMSYPAEDPRIIGYGRPAYDTPGIDELAMSVILGSWGNGQERKDRLTAAGYDYDAIQRRVNELLK